MDKTPFPKWIQYLFLAAVCVSVFVGVAVGHFHFHAMQTELPFLIRMFISTLVGLIVAFAGMVVIGINLLLALFGGYCMYRLLLMACVWIVGRLFSPSSGKPA